MGWFRTRPALLFLLPLLLSCFPRLDLWVSELFYVPGLGFPAKGTGCERLIYHSIGYVLGFALLALVFRWRQGTATGIRGKQLSYLLWVLALGPGLAVNGVLKEYWGRSRPVQVVQFGGHQTFTPAWVISDQGGKSFSSGHAAAGFYLVVLACTAAKRRFWVILALSYSLLMGLMRIAAGGHFLSDVLVSWVIVLGIALGLRKWFFSDLHWKCGDPC